MDTNKKAPFIIAIVVILIALGIVLAQRSPEEEDEVVVETPAVVTLPNETKTPPAATPAEPSGYTLETVASHNTTSD